MIQFEEMIERVYDEISDSQHYADMAIDLKDSDKDTADLYNALSGDEAKHAELITARIHAIIKKWQAEGKTIPEPMKLIWDREHKNIVNRLIKAKVTAEMYKK